MVVVVVFMGIVLFPFFSNSDYTCVLLHILYYACRLSSRSAGGACLMDGHVVVVMVI